MLLVPGALVLVALVLIWRVVYCVRFGEDVRVTRLPSPRRISWDQVENLAFTRVTARTKLGVPIARYMMLRVSLKRGTGFSVKVSQQQADDLCALLTEVGHKHLVPEA